MPELAQTPPAKLSGKRAAKFRELELSQDFSIENTLGATLNVCTTGISKAEMSLISIPPNIKLCNRLTPQTQILVAYRASFTHKYIQALKWRIPIVSPQFLYDLHSNYKKYEILPFSGARFTTSELNRDLCINYFTLLGAEYDPNCSVFTDFLVCDSVSSEKYNFCIKHSIPVIKTTDAFKNNFDALLKDPKRRAQRIAASSIFSGKIFLLDSSLPQPLFNKLRRLIIEQEGTRVSTPSEKVNFIFTLDHQKYSEYRESIFHYQYVFDCIEAKALLFPDYYRVASLSNIQVLGDVVATVDSELGSCSTEYENKLRALGAKVKSKLDMRTTHFITKSDHSNTKGNSYIAVLPEWVDQALSSFRALSTDRFAADGISLNLKRRLATPKEDNIHVQFTGIPRFLISSAIKKLKEHGIKYTDASYFDNCTHLIMGQPSISEKFLCTLVSGGWILKPDFIESMTLQSFKSCEQFEWKCDNETLEKDRRPIESVKKWRTQIQKTGKKPFHRWRVKVYASSSKYSTYSALFKAGGGEVTTNDDFTHVFFDRGFQGDVPEECARSTDKIFAHLFNRV